MSALRLIRRHIAVLLLVAVPAVVVPLALLAPPGYVPDAVGIFAILYVLLWGLYVVLTTVLLGGVLLLKRQARPRALGFVHAGVLMAMVIYAVLLLGT